MPAVRVLGMEPALCTSVKVFFPDGSNEHCDDPGGGNIRQLYHYFDPSIDLKVMQCSSRTPE